MINNKYNKTYLIALKLNEVVLYKYIKFNKKYNLCYTIGTARAKRGVDMASTWVAEQFSAYQGLVTL